MSNGTVIFTDGQRGASSQALDSIHRFERAGLGKAPFRVTGYGEYKYQACHGAPIQPGTSCDFCGTACIYVANIRAADGKKFHVGLDCVEKVGDAGMVSAIKHSPEYRKIQRDKRYARDEVIKAELETLLSQVRERYPVYAGDFDWRLPRCGMAGRARIRKEMRELLAKPVESHD